MRELIIRTKKAEKESKIILGIDPGSTIIGYGLIKVKNAYSKPEVISYGYIDLSKVCGVEKKLLQLNKDLKEIIKTFMPDYMAVESLFYFKNLKTVVPVMQSRGVILFTAAQMELKVYDYTPLQVKQTVSGYGRADKSMISKLVRSSLEIEKDIKPDDVSDALAIALCHFRFLIAA